MAENDAMEGKKLELQMFEEKILEAIEIAEKQKLDSAVIKVGDLPFEIKIEKVGKNIKIHAFGEEILTLEEGNKFTYNKEGLKNIQEKLEKDSEFDYRKLGLPNIEYIEYLEKLGKKKEEEPKENPQKDEEDLSKDKEEKEEEKEEENEEKEKTEDEEKEKIAKKHNVKSDQVIHVSMDRRITANDNFQGLAKWAEKYNDVYVIPGKDEFSWDTIGINKDGEEEIVNNKETQGKNPDVTIKRVDGKEITEIRPIAMYQIDNKQSYAIIRDEAGKSELLWCRKEEGNEKAFWGIGVPEADTKNIHEKPVEGREIMDSRHNSSYDLAKKAGEVKYGWSLEKRGIPSKEGKGVQVEEVEGTAKQNRQLRKEDIIEDLLKRDGIVDRAKAMPGLYEYWAEEILSFMENYSNITYEQAVERVKKSGRREEKEEDQKMPSDNLRRRREY